MRLLTNILLIAGVTIAAVAILNRTDAGRTFLDSAAI
jgi:hypothetical protein